MMCTKSYQRISKRKARRLYNQGKPLYFHTSRLLWNNSWQNPIPVEKDEEDERSRKEYYQWLTNKNLHKLINGNPEPFIEQFDLHVSYYASFCCDKERGKRVIFLIDAQLSVTSRPRTFKTKITN